MSGLAGNSIAKIIKKKRFFITNHHLSKKSIPLQIFRKSCQRDNLHPRSRPLDSEVVQTVPLNRFNKGLLLCINRQSRSKSIIFLLSVFILLFDFCFLVKKLRSRQRLTCSVVIMQLYFFHFQGCFTVHI